VGGGLILGKKILSAAAAACVPLHDLRFTIIIVTSVTVGMIIAVESKRWRYDSSPFNSINVTLNLVTVHIMMQLAFDSGHQFRIYIQIIKPVIQQHSIY
jgi:hypothetical protein